MSTQRDFSPLTVERKKALISTSLQKFALIYILDDYL
jgi:hypothetical protein